ncbi:MAG: acyl-CoA thioesterase, partial [Haliea sp.]|nr:acyl-CoA thioesterase [Haliea sp.]
MTDLERDYPVVLYQDVVWGDMDAFGHVNNTTYFRYFEDARIAYFDKIEIGKVKSETGLGPILATTHCNFKLPLEYPDKIRIAGRARLMGPKKFNMEYLVYSERFDAVAAEG